MKQWLPVPALIVFFLVATTVAVVSFTLRTPKLLILQSSSKESPWVRGVDRGIHRVLDDKRQYAVRWFYMDTDRHPWQGYRENIGQTAHRLIDQWNPDVVLAVDEDAQQYVMKQYVGNLHLQIVFAGVNGALEAYGYTRAPNVTGIVQHRALSAIRDAVSSMTHLGQAAEGETVLRVRPKTDMVRAKPDHPALQRSGGEEERNAACVSEPPWSSAFPQWHSMIRAMDNADKKAPTGILEWWPIRLGSSVRGGLLEPSRFTRQDIPTHTEPPPRMQAVVPIARSEIRIFHLGDQSTSARNDEAFIRTFDWRPVRLVASRLVGTFSDWQAAIEGAAGRTDFVLVSDYRLLSRSAQDPTLVPPRDVVQWTVAHSSVPVVGTNGFFVQDGGAFAVGASPFEQGTVATGMAVNLLERRIDPKAIPLASTKEFVVFLRGSKLREEGLSLPQIYESFARATNNYFD